MIEPSPVMVTTLLSGRSSAAPMPAGRPQPSRPARRWSVIFRTREPAVLGDPHLMLANITGGDEVIAGGFRQFFNRPGVDAGTGRVIAERELLLSVAAQGAPAVDCQISRIQSHQRIAQVTANGDVDAAQLADFGVVQVHVDDFGIRGELVGLACGPVIKPGAAANQHIAFLYGQIGGAGAMHAQHAEIILGVRVGAARWLSELPLWECRSGP